MPTDNAADPAAYAVAAQSAAPGAENAHWTVRFLLFLFVIICIFDPADQVLQGKVAVFIALWLVTFLNLALRQHDAKLPGWLLTYVLAFVAIPLLSIVWYFIIDGRQPFEGFQLLKAYLLISLAPILVLNKVDLLAQLSAVLTALACCVIAVFTIIMLEPESLEPLRTWGVVTGVLSIDERSYGDLRLLQVYFVTSAMLAVSIAYYFDRLMSVPGVSKKLAYLLLTGINILGMILAGTRNNIFVALLLPFILWPLYTRRVVLNGFYSLLALTLIAWFFAGQLQAFFDPTETSNDIKLTLLQDYIDLFDDPVTLLFGQGLGAYHFWSARGYSYYVTELTYLEMVRNFGLIGFGMMTILLLFPVARAFVTVASQERALAVAYALYLLMAVSNPHLFASTGMLILSILIANIAMNPSPDGKMRSVS